MAELTPSQIIEKINLWVTTNGDKQNTGAHLNIILNAIMEYVGVGYAFMGEAPSSAPSPDVPVVYFAGPGSYTGYDDSAVEIPDGSIGLFTFNGSAWSPDVIKVVDPVSVSQNTSTGKTQLKIGDTPKLTVDFVPEGGSHNLVESGGVAEVIGFSLQPFEEVQHNTSSSSQSTSGNRFSLLFNIPSGYKIVAQSSWQRGIFAGIWDNRDNALIGGVEGKLQNISSYVTSQIVDVSEYDGVLRIGTAKNDDSAFSQQDIEAFLGSLTFSITKPNNVLELINNEVKEREKLPAGIGFLAIYTNGVFNANNTSFKIEVPAFACWVKDEYKHFDAQEISYSWHLSQIYRRWFALVLSDDLSSIEMVDWTQLVTKKNVIAFIARSEETLNSPATAFYGCIDSKWFIDGENHNYQDIKAVINELFGVQRNFYPSSSGKYVTDNHNGKQLFFPVNSGDTINIHTGDFYSFVCFVKSYTVPEVEEGDIDYSETEGYTNRIRIEPNSEYNGIVPNDAKFIVVAFGNNTEHDLEVQSISINSCIVYLRNDAVDDLNNCVEDVETLNAQVGESSYSITSSDDFPYKRRHQVSNSEESLTGNRYTIGLDIPKGTAIRVRSTYTPGINVNGYDTFENGCIGGNESYGRLQIYQSGYNTNEIVGVANVEQVLIIKWKNSDESAITDAQIEQMLASLTVEVVIPGTGLTGDVETLKEQVQEIIDNPTKSSVVERDKKALYVGTLVQKSISGNTFSDSTTIVTQKCALATPHYDVKVSIKLPIGYRVGFKTGYSTTGWSLTWVNDSGWLINGQSYTFEGHNGQVYRTYFGKTDGSALTVVEVTELVSNGEIQLTYHSTDGTIVERNSHTEHYVKGLMRKFTGTLTNDDSLHKMPVFTHLSDIHGDARRYENFVNYSEAIEADAALVSGDLVPMCGAEDFTDYIDDIADKYNVMLLPCMGNHDARSNTTEQKQNVVLAHSIQKYELQTPVGKTYPTYYYKDITSQSIRIISLNLYCAGQKDTNEWRLTQDQITWFVNTLASTPTGYGVIVMMHSPETTTNKDSNYAKFYQKFETGTITHNNPYLPIRKIIDAFIGKTTFSGIFDEEVTGGVTDTITISADFTSVDASTEFICYVTGHRHQDCIGYVDGATNMQLMCNIALGFSLYGDSNYHYYAEETDVPRGGKGFVQDLMNVYIVDRVTGTLRIARIGSNMNQDFEMRDYMTIPYKAN